MPPTLRSAWAAFLLLGVAAAPPSAAGTRFLAGLHFNTGFPQGELEDQIERDAYGLDGEIFYAPSASPFAVGLDLSWMNYGSETRNEPFSTTIPDVTVDVTTTNNVVQAFFVFRAQIPRGPVQPYGDALVGLNYLFTETKISDEDEIGDIASTTNRDDTAFAYGFGGGIMVPVYTRLGSERGGGPLEVLIDAGARYVKGDEAEYLKEGSIRRSNGKVVFDSIRSRTDLTRFHIGATVRF